MANFEEAKKKLNPEPNTLEWCQECNRWHVAGSLTICTLLQAKRLLMDEPEPTAPLLPSQDRPWRRVE